jgi:carbonic anhydrase
MPKLTASSTLVSLLALPAGFVLLAALAPLAAAEDHAAASGHGSTSASAKAATSAKGAASVKAQAGKEASKEAAAPKEAAKEAAPPSEVDLSVRIAERLAVLKAKQAERAAAQARAAAHGAKVRKAKPEAAMITHQSEHWSYEGENGPANWGKINAAWSKCATGDRQSPIDIRNGMKVELEQITFDYRAAGFNVIDNGHTIQVNVGGGNYITVMNRQYELLQFHFHRPSEERINGKGFEMVVHMVHKDAEGHLAVVAVLVERGKQQSLIQTVWNNLPLEKNDVVSPTIVIDINELLPTRRDYFTYMGSLTTPPCSEGVLWMVMKEPVQASPAQLALFSRLYPMNARPVQTSSGRVIKESN